MSLTPYDNSIAKILIGVFLLLLITLGCFQYFGAHLYLNWELTSSLHKEMTELLTFDKGPFNFTISAPVNFITEVFLGSSVTQTRPIGVLLMLLIWIGSCGVLAFSTHLKSFWFFIFSGIVILFLNYMDLDSLGIFGSKEGAKWVTIGWVLLVLGPTYYFHSFNNKPSFLIKWGIISIITGLFLAICSLQNPLLLEWSIARTHLGIAALTFFFVLFISEELLFGLLYVLTKTRGSANNEKHLIVFGGVYLGALGLFWSRKAGLIDFEFDIINPYYLMYASALVALYTIQFKQFMFNQFLNKDFEITWFFLLIGSIALVHLNLGAAYGNDAHYDAMNYFIIYAHLGFGGIFFIYLIVNFIDPLVRGLQVYKVVYTEQSFPYITSKIAGLILILAVFLIADKIAYKKLVGAEYNYSGDYFKASGELPLAMEYFRQGSVFAWDSHHSHYQLGDYYLKKGNIDKSLYHFNRSTKRNPSEFAYLNTADAYSKKEKTTSAIGVLNKAQSDFFNSGEIQNNLAVRYFENGNQHSARQILENAGPTDQWNQAILVNTWFMGTPEWDSENYLTATIPLKVNMLGSNLRSKTSFNPKLSPTELEPFTLHTAALLINANLLGDSIALHIQSDKILSTNKSGDWNREILNSQAIGLFLAGYANDAFKKLDAASTLSDALGKGLIFEQMGKLALHQGAPKLAIDFFIKAKRYGVLMSDYNLMIAGLEAQNWSLSKNSLKSILAIDSSNNQLTNSIMPIIEGLNNQSVAYYYYRPEEFNWTSLEQISLISTNDLRSIWKRYVETTLDAGHIEDITDKMDLLITLVNPAEKSFYENYLDTAYDWEEVGMNAFNEWPMIKIMDDPTIDLQKKYDLLIDAIELNPYSVPILKMYCFTAIQLGVPEYADTAYMRLRELLPEKEMNTFAQMYYLEQRKRMANSKEWL